MLAARRPELVAVLRELLKGAGFNWQACVSPEPRARAWLRPPLVTELSIGDRELMPHLAIPAKLEVDGLLDVYERFVSGYVRRRVFHDTDPVKWLRRELRMSGDQARSLFTPVTPGKQRLSLHLNLVQLAALVHYNVDSVVERGVDTFKVTTFPDYYVFGVKEGELLTNQKRQAPKISVNLLYSADGDLQNIARGVAQTREACLMERIYLWAELHRHRLGSDYEGLKMALRVLWWRGSAHRWDTLGYLTLKEHSNRAWLAALSEAAKYRQFEDPMASMQEIMVPQFMRLQRFRELFANAQQPRLKGFTARMCSKWDEVLYNLEIGMESVEG